MVSLDELLSVEQQQTARQNLEIYATSQGDSSPLNHANSARIQGILGWGPNGATITIRRVGQWYHWKVRLASRVVAIESSGPELLPELRRYWKDPTQ